ncbi:MAG: hypothetical protein KAV42_08655 [Candidatus Krumholzibacteria bacterium]|nr:hypothetical protein [Candidatus Krumholzibacteria bacterium]
MIRLGEENTALFGEQINDHVSKLNELMSHSAGELFREAAYRKTCFANRLLVGSTKMLGLEDWSITLSMFGELLVRIADSTGCWDENISQIVSEILENEEQIAIDVVSGELNDEAIKQNLSGIQQEISVLMEESYHGSESHDAEFEELGSVLLEPASGDESSMMEKAPAINNGADDGSQGSFGTIDRLQNSLLKVRERYLDYLADPEENSVLMRDLELSFGECEFYLGLVGNILGRIGDMGKMFKAKVSSRTVLDGVEDFIAMNSRMRGWDIGTTMRTDSFPMEREVASDLAGILEHLLFDICRMQRNGEESLDIDLGIENKGSFLVATLKDNVNTFLSDSEIDRDDAVAFYRGLLKARGLLKKWSCLLWVEPGGGADGRFVFTFPRSSVMTDYHLFTASGVSVAIPSRTVETVLDASSIEIKESGSMRHIQFKGENIPVCSLGEIAPEEVDISSGNSHIAIMGLAEKRLGIFFDSSGNEVEGIIDQLTGGEWASVTRTILNIGETEYPVLEAGLVLDKYSLVMGYGGSLEESGFSVEEEEVESTVSDRISRV